MHDQLFPGERSIGERGLGFGFFTYSSSVEIGILRGGECVFSHYRYLSENHLPNEQLYICGLTFTGGAASSVQYSTVSNLRVQIL